jgi:hypothetical protein
MINNSRSIFDAGLVVFSGFLKNTSFNVESILRDIKDNIVDHSTAK